MQNPHSRPGKEAQSGGVIFRFLFLCVLLVFLASLAGVNLMRGIRVRTAARNGGDDVDVETPAGSFRIRAHERLDPAAMGVPVYPGARRTDSSGGAEFEWVSSDGREDKNVSVAGATYVTPDPLEKVLDYYRSELSSLVVIREQHRRARLEYTHEGLKRIISLAEENDGTHIGVAAIGEPASN